MLWTMAEYGYIFSCLSTWASNIGDRKHVCLELYLDVGPPVATIKVVTL